MPAGANLGPVLARYPGRRLRKADIFTLFLPGVLAVLLPTLYGLWRYLYAYQNYGPVAAEDWSWPWFFLASFALLIFAILVAIRLLAGHTVITVHQYGLQLRRPLSRLRRLRWSEIAGVSSQATREHFLGIPLRTHLRVTLHLCAGRALRLPRDFPGLPELLAHIKAGLYPRLLPEMQSLFDRGQWLHFGPVAVQREALQIRGQRTPWAQVQGLAIRDGCLVVEFAQESPARGARPIRPICIPLESILNPELLLQIVQTGVKV